MNAAYGSTGSPPPGRTSRWRWGPVEFPVEPPLGLDHRLQDQACPEKGQHGRAEDEHQGPVDMTEPPVDERAWYGAEMARRQDWIHVFSSTELQELDAAIRGALSARRGTASDGARSTCRHGLSACPHRPPLTLRVTTPGGRGHSAGGFLPSYAVRITRAHTGTAMAPATEPK